MKRLEIMTAFWGERYARYVAETLFPSLYQVGNLPIYSEIIHRIYCTPADKEWLDSQLRNRYFHTGTRHNWIEYITDMVEYGNHESLGACYRDQIKREVLTVAAPADLVFGKGLWALLKKVRPGDVVICAQPRIDETKIADVKRLLAMPHDNRVMVRLCMDLILHQMVERGKAHDERQLWRCWKRPGFYSVQFADPPPVAFWGQPWMLDAWQEDKEWVGDLGVVDHQLPDLAFRNAHLLAVQDSDEFFWAELTDPQREVLPVPGGLKTEAMRWLDKLEVRYHFGEE